MFSLLKPTPATLRRVIAEQSALSFTYPEVGATANGAAIPEGYVVDHTRIELGQGPDVFARAKAALEHWKQFDLGWLEAYPNDTFLRKGETVVVVARAGGLWWINAARIVYTIDEQSDTATRFGFAYGTLPGHVESGEERFLLEWDRATDAVSFDILAFSRPRHLLVRLNRRRARAMQKRFAAESASAMQRAAASPT
jgi:uncharacterized protein (UPF0548 family)